MRPTLPAPARIAVAVLAAATTVSALLPASASAQVLQGRVIDARNLSSVPGTLIRLLDRGGSLRALTIADDEGRYQIQAPEPGSYTVVAARLGIEDFRSQGVAMPNPDEVYSLDMMVVPSALALEGIEVTAARNRELSRALRLVLGTSPGALRSRPITSRELGEYAEESRRISDMIRVRNYPGMEVRVGDEGPCFLMRIRGCAQVFLDGARIPAPLVDQIPLDLLEVVVVVQQGESREYDGAVLLYTLGYLGNTR